MKRDLQVRSNPPLAVDQTSTMSRGSSKMHPKSPESEVVWLRGLSNELWKTLIVNPNLAKVPDVIGQSSLLFSDTRGRVVDARIRKGRGYKEAYDAIDALLQKGTLVIAPQYGVYTRVRLASEARRDVIYIDLTPEFIKVDAPDRTAEECTIAGDAVIVLAAFSAMQKGLMDTLNKRVIMVSRFVPRLPVKTPQPAEPGDDVSFIEQIPIITIVSPGADGLGGVARSEQIPSDRMRPLLSHEVVQIDPITDDRLLDRIITPA